MNWPIVGQKPAHRPAPDGPDWHFPDLRLEFVECFWRDAGNRSLRSHLQEFVEPFPGLRLSCPCAGSYRLRGTYPHLLHSIAPPSVSGFVTRHRLRTVERVFDCRVRQIEPVLQEINAQHLLDPDRRAAIARFRIERLDQRAQVGPGSPCNPRCRAG
jgi:hypothetical protein